MSSRVRDPRLARGGCSVRKHETPTLGERPRSSTDRARVRRTPLVYAGSPIRPLGLLGGCRPVRVHGGRSVPHAGDEPLVPARAPRDHLGRVDRAARLTGAGAIRQQAQSQGLIPERCVVDHMCHICIERIVHAVCGRCNNATATPVCSGEDCFQDPPDCSVAGS